MRVWLLTIPSRAILRASLDTLYCDHSKSLGIITVWPQLIVCHYYALCPRPERLVLVLFTDSTSYWIHTVLSVIVHLYVLVSWKAIYLHAYSSCAHTFVSGQGSYSRVAQNEARGWSRRHYEAKMVHLLPSSAEQLKMPIHDIDEYDFVWCGRALSKKVSKLIKSNQNAFTIRAWCIWLALHLQQVPPSTNTTWPI